jgi:hypothetical protein
MHQQEPGWEQDRRVMRLVPDKMGSHMQALEQYLGAGTLHPLYQKVFPDDNFFEQQVITEKNGKGIDTSSGLSSGLTRFQSPLNPSLSDRPSFSNSN